MLASGLGLALTPAPLLLAALIVYALPARASRAVRPLAALGVAGALVFLGADAALVASGGRLSVSMPAQAGGVTLALRLDPIGVVVALAATTAALLLVADNRLRQRHIAGLLLCTAGAIIAAVAADALTLFAGVEAAGLGTAYMLRPNRRRFGRGLLAALTVQHGAALGLLAAAVQLQTAQGTSAFAALPAGAVNATVAWPWAMAAAVRLLAPGILPVRGSRVPTAAWAATAAVPCGAVMLLRLREAASGMELAVPVTVVFAATGACVAVLAAYASLRASGSPRVTGRALCVLAAAPAVALTGFGPDAALALAAGLCATQFAAAMSAAWENAPWRTHRWTAAAGLLSAGGLPLGFGAVALVLELGWVLSLGRAGFALLVALLLAAVGGCAGATRAAGRMAGIHLAASADAEAGVTAARRLGQLPLAGIGAAVVSLLCAFLPGGMLTVLALLSGGGDQARAAGQAAILAPGGGWAGGYFLVALCFLAITAGAAVVVGTGQLRLAHDAAAATAATEAAPLLLEPRRALRRPIAVTLLAVRRVDEWLLVQPQLPLLVGGSLIALLLIH